MTKLAQSRYVTVLVIKALFKVITAIHHHFQSKSITFNSISNSMPDSITIPWEEELNIRQHSISTKPHLFMLQLPTSSHELLYGRNV